MNPASAVQSQRLPAGQGRSKGGDLFPLPARQSDNIKGTSDTWTACPALVTPQTRETPQTPVSQGKREMLGERPGQLSHLPPPSAGTAPPRQRRACILPCRGRAVRRSCRLIIRHTFFRKGIQGEPAPAISSQNEDTTRTGAVLPTHPPNERPDAIDNCGSRCSIR